MTIPPRSGNTIGSGNMAKTAPLEWEDPTSGMDWIHVICRPAALRGESGDHQQVAGTMLAAMEYVLEYVLVENEDVLGLVVGSWAHFPLFITSQPHSPVTLNQTLGTSL